MFLINMITDNPVLSIRNIGKNKPQIFGGRVFMGHVDIFNGNIFIYFQAAVIIDRDMAANRNIPFQGHGGA